MQPFERVRSRRAASILGTRGAAGRGVGPVPPDAAPTRYDREGVPPYPAHSNPRNRRFSERLGQPQPGRAPPRFGRPALDPMRREAVAR
jgi:hypothetical protein